MAWSDDEQSMVSYFEDLLTPQRASTLQQLLDQGARQSLEAEPVETPPCPEADFASEITPRPDVDSAPASEPLSSQWQPMETEAAFQALFFEVNGMRFAVPLKDLGGIYPLGEVTQLPGMPDWFAGLLGQGERQYRLVDSVRWFMPATRSGAASEYGYFLVLGEHPWGLGIDRLLGTETLHRDDVRWRRSAGSQPWLAGTVKSRMCVLLYCGYLAQQFDQGLPITGKVGRSA